MGIDSNDIRKNIYREITNPAKLAKQGILRGSHLTNSTIDDGTRNQLSSLNEVFEAYPAKCYAKGAKHTWDNLIIDIEVDSQLHPKNHLCAFYKLVQLMGKKGMRLPQVFPLRTSWVPAHTHVDTRILCTEILDISYTSTLPLKHAWSQVIDDNHPGFRQHDSSADKDGHYFWGSVETDGVSISIIKKTPAEKQGHCGERKVGDCEPKPKPSKRKCNVKRKSGNQKPDSHSLPDIPYIHHLSQDELCQTEGKVLLLDPGRRDILHGIHETSTAENPKRYRLTKMQQDKHRRTRRFQKILLKEKQKVSEDAVQKAENYLGEISNRTLDVAIFSNYIKRRAEVWETLSSFYSTTSTVHVGSSHPVNDKHKEYQAKEQPVQPDNTVTTTPRAPTYLERGPLNYPLHRKLRLSAYINKKRADAYVARDIRKRFSDDTILAIGNWSAFPARYHPPQRGIGLRKMFRKHGFRVLLVDEFKTSSLCPACETGELKKFHYVKNPRPYRYRECLASGESTNVLCHGLVQCQNVDCGKLLPKPKVTPTIKNINGDKNNKKAEEVPRLRCWNRDTAAACNFLHILKSLRQHGTIPPRFQRSWMRQATTTTNVVEDDNDDADNNANDDDDDDDDDFQPAKKRISK
ncbi:hypothetical protein IW150_000626 [Coemansia sp. RSA 2607]|nr:hypothetical protein IW150_000626 [Coemansia sp. RSA 2607]